MNCAPDILSAAIAAAAGSADIEWRSPTAAQRFNEYKDRDFLAAIDQVSLGDELSAWWPDSGPRWDALGLTARDGGVVLVEAKANIPEIAAGSGCGSGASGSEAGLANRAQIADALRRTREHYGVGEDVASAWMETHCYQYANRLAHLCFFERQGVPAVLAHVYFVNDTTHLPTTAAEFDAQPAVDRQAMGLEGVDIERAVGVYLPAVPAAYHRVRALMD